LVCGSSPHLGSTNNPSHPPTILQTPYKTIIIPCPNFDPIDEVILLENSNEWNLSLAKRRIIEKKGARIEKQKR
jgi:hypothetical protein